MYNDKILVLIVSCETRACDPNIKRLKKAFDDDYFIVREFKAKSKDENKYMYKALHYASYGPWDNKKTELNEWGDFPCIIIKDSSITNVDNLAKKIRKALTKNIDIFFLCTWNDRCEKYVPINKDLSEFVYSASTQAICYRPIARDHIRRMLYDNAKNQLELSTILRREIENKHLKGALFIPNLIHYDIKMATSNHDYIKVNSCSLITSENANTNITIFIWFIALSIIILLVAWCLLDMTPGVLNLA